MGRWFRRQFPLPSDPHIGIHAGVTFPARLGTRPRVPPLIAGAEFQTTSGSGTLLDNYSVAVLNFSGQECAGETVAELALHQAASGASAVGGVGTFESERFARGVDNLESQPATFESACKMRDLQVHEYAQFRQRQSIENHDVIETVEELVFECSAHRRHYLLMLRIRVECRVDEVLRAEI